MTCSWVSNGCVDSILKGATFGRSLVYFSCEGRESFFPKKIKKSSMESARFRSVGTEDHAPVRECTQPSLLLAWNFIWWSIVLSGARRWWLPSWSYMNWESVRSVSIHPLQRTNVPSLCETDVVTEIASAQGLLEMTLPQTHDKVPSDKVK